MSDEMPLWFALSGGAVAFGLLVLCFWLAVRYRLVALGFEAIWLAAWGFIAVGVPLWFGGYLVAAIMAVPFGFYLWLRLARAH
jgi:hypothetical protein